MSLTAREVTFAIRARQRFAVLLDELDRVNEYAAAAARRVEHLAVVRLDDFDHHPYDALGREELPTALALGRRKVAQKIFVDLTKDVALGIGGNISKRFQQ